MLLVLTQVAVAGTAAANIDLWQQFPKDQGDNGFFAYGGQSGGNYRALTKISDYFFGTPEQGYFIPYVARSTSPWINMHPSMMPSIATVYPPERAVLAWQPPRTTRYDLKGQFFQSGGSTVIVSILKNQEVLFSRTLTVASPAADFSLNAIELSPGDRLYFEVDAGVNDNNDTTRLSGQIKPTSLPWQILLLGE